MSTRTVEVIRVGTIDLDINYPGKQLVRLRDLSTLYEGGSVKSLEELHRRIRGKRLSAINVEVWDQISGAYLGSYNTDEHGTLILPTDKKFVEVLHWKLAGGGYSDCFNGERAAGMPGLFFYFPCNERSSTIKSFPGVSGQQADLPGGVSQFWGWYDSGFFNRPALRVLQDAEPLQLTGADPIGRRSFQFLWYCIESRTPRTIFAYANLAFTLEVTDTGVLKGTVFGQVSEQGTTELQDNTWYLIQINTELVGGWNPLAQPYPTYEYQVTMNVYLGGALELSVVPPAPLSPLPEASIPGTSNLVSLTGMQNDGFDELRHLDRELYDEEISDYAAFLKQGRVAGKSKGSLGSVGW